MLCPNCNSQATQKCSAIYSAGTYSTTSTVSASTYLSNGATASSNTSVTTSGSSILAERCRPPRKPWSIVYAFLNVFFFILVVFPVVDLVGGGALIAFLGSESRIVQVIELITSFGGSVKVPLLKWICIAFVGSTLLVGLRANFLLTQGKLYPERRRRWESRWYCHSCDSLFEQD